MTSKQSSQPGRSPASALSRTSHSPILLLLAILVALISTALWLPPASPSAPPSIQHMQRILHNAAAPLRNAPFVSPLAARIRPQQSLASFAHSHSTARAMASSSENARHADTVDSDSFHPRGPDAEGGNAQDPASNGAPLPLPAPEDAEAIKLDMSKGDGVKLDALGPLVVNVDGSLSRIANWNKMAEIERQNTLRILGKRNKERLANLRGEGEKTGAEQ